MEGNGNEKINVFRENGNESAQGAAPAWEKMRNESVKRGNYQMEGNVI